MSRKRVPPTKAPNPFGETAGRVGPPQPPDAPAVARPRPVTAFVVSGQPRDVRRAYGHVLTEHGWVKE
jgi:hypothetical protein